MKYTLLRLGRAGACLVLAGALLTGCSLLPAATPRHDSPSSEQALYDSSRLEDGKLRMVYSYSGNGGGTVLRGGTVLYEGSSTDSIQLVPDSLTGENTHYLVSSSTPGTEERRSTLYDAEGKPIAGFDRAVSVTLSGGLMLTKDTGDMRAFEDDYIDHSLQLTDTATGDILPVPEQAYGCLLPDEAGQALVFNCYALPEGLSHAYDDTEMPLHQYVLVTDREGNVLYQAEGCYADSLYTDDGTLNDWVELTWHDANWDITRQALYSTATGQLLGDENSTVSNCGSGAASLSNAEGGYTLYDLTGEEPVELGQFEADLYLYTPGCIVLVGGEGTTEDIPYTLVDTASGERILTRRIDHDTDAGTVAVLTADDVLKVYDDTTGALLTDVDTQPVAGAAHVSVSALSDGYALLTYTDESFSTIACQTYGASGLLWSSEGADTQHSYMSYLTRADGAPLLTACRYNKEGVALYDMMDVEGNIRLKGLGSCYTSVSAGDWPEGCFFARQGFWYGVMDTQGRWLYRTGIFATTDDESYGNYNMY